MVEVTQADRDAFCRYMIERAKMDFIGADRVFDANLIMDTLSAYRIACVKAALEEVERLRAALKPFADCCEWIATDESDEEWAKFRLLIKDYRAARAAIDPASVEVKP